MCSKEEFDLFQLTQKENHQTVSSKLLDLEKKSDNSKLIVKFEQEVQDLD